LRGGAPALGTVAPAKNPTSVAKDWVRVAE